MFAWWMQLLASVTIFVTIGLVGRRLIGALDKRRSR